MADSPSSESADNNQQTQKGWGALKQHVLDNKVKVAMWATRIFTMLFTIGYIIPFFG